MFSREKFRKVPQVPLPDQGRGITLLLEQFSDGALQFCVEADLRIRKQYRKAAAIVHSRSIPAREDGRPGWCAGAMGCIEIGEHHPPGSHAVDVWCFDVF